MGEQYLVGPFYPTQLLSGAHNPADATNYFFSCGTSAPTTLTGALSRTYFVQPSRVQYALVNVRVDGTLGTSEAGSIYLRVNDTTDYLIGSMTWDAVLRVLAFVFDPPIDVLGSDYFEIKIVTPTFATNPTSVSYYGSVWAQP